MRLWLFSLLTLIGSVAQATPAGTFSDPVLVDAFPWAARGTTVGGSDVVDGYSCAAATETGPERVYRFTLPAAALVMAWVEAGAPVDVDVQLLDDASLSGRQASTCLARGDVIAEAELSAGMHFVVVDTYAGASPGGYVLHLEAIGDAWTERVIADGVTWRARRFAQLAGDPQVVNALVVDGTRPGVSVRAIRASGCQTVAEMAQQAGAIAGVNGGYFDATCAPVSLLRASGTLAGTNTASVARGAFGISMSGEPMTALIAPGVDWPEAYQAHGGGPLLARGGVAQSGASAWAQEGLSAADFLGPNPRTSAGYDAMGRVHLVMADGRRANAAGMSLDGLAAFMTSAEIGASDAVNLDGGGSSAMYVAGITPNGTVNYPSDGGATEIATHPGARQVSGGFFVFAAPYDHPPRFTTTPPAGAAIGAPYRYDAGAIDLDVDDVLAFALTDAPSGAVLDPSGTLRYTPPAGVAPSVTFTLTVDDGRGGRAVQSWQLEIAGALRADAGTSPTTSAGSCTAVATPNGTSAPLLIVLLVLGARLRRSRVS